MLVICVRACVLYILVLVVTRLMGKRELGQLQPFEFVIALMMADLAATPMGNTGIPIFYGILPLITLLLIHLVFSFLMIKSRRIRDILCGKPVIVITEGKMDYAMLRKLRYTQSDIEELLREKDVFSSQDVKYAILETSGKLNVLLKRKAQPATYGDLVDTAARKEAAP